VLKQYYQGKPTGYHITYYTFDYKGDFKFVSVNYTTNMTNLTDLAVDALYVVNVSAVSSGGVGPAKMVISRTDAEGKKVLNFCASFALSEKDPVTYELS